MLRSVASLARRLQTPTLANFSATHHHTEHHGEAPVVITKHNPKGEKDLRGYEQLSNLNQRQKQYSPLHSTTHSPLALYSFFSYLPNSLCRLMGRLVEHPKSQIASDSLYLPKIVQNGIPIFDSIRSPASYLTINKLLTRLSPLTIALISPQPTLTVITYGLMFAVYYQSNWKVAKDLVIKAELSPQTEEIVYQKVCLLGTIVTSRVKIIDLERLEYLQVFGQKNLSERSVRGLLNQEVVFRNRLTKELLLFDRLGIWNAEGINHELLL